MLRKGFFLIALFLFVLSFVVATLFSLYGGNNTTFEGSEQDDTLQGRLMWLYSQNDNKMLESGTLTNLIDTVEDKIIPVGEQTFTYGLERVFEFYKTNPGIPICLSQGENSSIYALVKRFPVECLRSVDNDSVYAVYKTAANDGSIHYVYIFFRAERSDNKELWVQQNPILIATKHLNYSDFESVKPGTLASEVQNIDPATRFYIDGVIKSNIGNARESIHLTSDGILTINYTLDEGNFVVSNIRKEAGFHFVSGDVIKILPQDLPGYNEATKY